VRVLLAIDDSEFSKAAIRFLISQAAPAESELRVLNVIEILTPQLPEMMGGLNGSMPHPLKSTQSLDF
jgi:hypothetical protein